MTGEPTRIVVTGASGNVGTGVLRALARQLPHAELVGVCRRPPTEGSSYAGVRWHAVDLSQPDAVARLAPAMEGADVVVHLALAVQPVRDADYLYRANVLGTQAVLAAMTSARVRQLVYASSLGIYAPGATAPVSETWPDTGQEASTYSRNKVIVERILDQFELEQPDTVVSRFRPTVVVQRDAAWLIRSLYLGPLVPKLALQALRERLLPVLPLPTGIALQFVHADDVGDAVVRMIERRVRGSYNIAADVLDTPAVAGLVGARPVDVNPRVVRRVVVALNRARVIALTPGWYDVATGTPLMDTTKARDELGWTPTRSSTESAWELLEGLADGATGDSAATGWRADSPSTLHLTRRIHDVSLLLWTASVFARALGMPRAGSFAAIAAGANLVSGTPMALERVVQRRRDPVALLAPVTVVGALVASLRGGWTPVAATAVLQILNVVERKRPKLGDAVVDRFPLPVTGNATEVKSRE